MLAAKRSRSYPRKGEQVKRRIRRIKDRLYRRYIYIGRLRMAQRAIHGACRRFSAAMREAYARAAQ